MTKQKSWSFALSHLSSIIAWLISCHYLKVTNKLWLQSTESFRVQHFTFRTIHFKDTYSRRLHSRVTSTLLSCITFQKPFICNVCKNNASSFGLGPQISRSKICHPPNHQTYATTTSGIPSKAVSVNWPPPVTTCNSGRVTPYLRPNPRLWSYSRQTATYGCWYSS